MPASSEVIIYRGDGLTEEMMERSEGGLEPVSRSAEVPNVMWRSTARWLVAAVVAGALVAATFATAVSAERHLAVPSGGRMSLRLVSPTGAVTIASRRVIFFRLHVTGMRFDAMHIGGKPVAGHGHIQVYLDRVPPVAYRKLSLTHLVVVVGAPSFRYQALPAWIKRHHGRHRFIFALAKNNNVLYPVRTVNVTVRVT